MLARPAYPTMPIRSNDLNSYAASMVWKRRFGILGSAIYGLLPKKGSGKKAGKVVSHLMLIFGAVAWMGCQQILGIFDSFSAHDHMTADFFYEQRPEMRMAWIRKGKSGDPASPAGNRSHSRLIFQHS